MEVPFIAWQVRLQRSAVARCMSLLLQIFRACLSSILVTPDSIKQHSRPFKVRSSYVCMCAKSAHCALVEVILSKPEVCSTVVKPQMRIGMRFAPQSPRVVLTPMQEILFASPEISTTLSDLRLPSSPVLCPAKSLASTIVGRTFANVCCCHSV